MKKYRKIPEGEKFWVVGDYHSEEGIDTVIYEYRKGVEHCLQVYTSDGKSFDPGDSCSITNFLPTEIEKVYTSLEEARSALDSLLQS